MAQRRAYIYGDPQPRSRFPHGGGAIPREHLAATRSRRRNVARLQLHGVDIADQISIHGRNLCIRRQLHHFIRRRSNIHIHGAVVRDRAGDHSRAGNDIGNRAAGSW